MGGVGLDVWRPANRRDGDELILSNYRFVGPDLFRTLSMPIRRGRALEAGDLGEVRGSIPAVISETTAQRVWPGLDALGRRFKRGVSTDPSFEVVGIVADGRPTALETAPPLMVYVPYTFRTRTRASLVVRTTAPSVPIGEIRSALQRVDPDVAIARVRPLEAVVDAATGSRRYQMRLFAAFGAVALVIAMLGVYSVTAYG